MEKNAIVTLMKKSWSGYINIRLDRFHSNEYHQRDRESFFNKGASSSEEYNSLKHLCTQ